MQAQPVALRGQEAGQGYMIRHEDNCYVVFPRHVTDPVARAQVIAEGAVSGMASVRTPFWQGIDLAVGVVRRGADEVCTEGLALLTGNPRAFAAQGRGTLVLVDAQGRVERLSMDIVRTGYLEFEARFVDPSVTARQGMSGSFLQVTGGLAGMALESIDATTLRFMRIEEIGMNVARWLGMQGGVSLAAQADTAEAAASEATAGLTLLSASTLARGPAEMPENMLVDAGAYVFIPDGPARIVFARPGDDPTLASLEVVSQPGEGTVRPQRLLVEVSALREGEGWRRFWSGEMPADGVLTTRPQLPTRAARIRLTVLSARMPGPVQIDRVAAR